MGSPTTLVSDLVEAFWSDGAVVVRGVVGPDDMAAAERALALLRDDVDLADLSAIAGVAEPARFQAGVDHWRSHPPFVALAARAALAGTVAELLGSERLWLYEDSVLVKDPGSRVPTRWHTDDGYFHVEGRQLATLWLPLDAAPLTAGALRFVRGSHLDPTRYRPTLFVTDDPIPGTEGALPTEPADDDTFGWDLEVGDLSIHHARTLHAAGGNAGATPRRALSIRYCGEDAVVRVKPGAPPKPHFDEVTAGTPLSQAARHLGLPQVWGPVDEHAPVTGE
jgi:ectoine hydroxylase-related dioxygenase (phytanoyl-CoA dioxygenase family)